MPKPELTAAIRDEILLKGPIPFARFMDLALYHPGYGYYNSTDEKIGGRGDYYTSSSVHPVFGELLARQLLQMEQLLRDGPFEKPPDGKVTILEMGAGKGTLCYDILNFIRTEAPAALERIRYVIVEKGKGMMEMQRSRLSPLFPEIVRWEADVPKGMVGVVLSNELVDAFPVHRIRISGNSIQEMYVDWARDRFIERFLDPAPEVLRYLKEYALAFNQPTELEVNLQGVEWMRGVGQALAQGFVVTIDYGYPAELLLTASRPKGTFLCYYKHTVQINPFDHLGEQDMTAHVDFTSLARAGREAGLSVIGFTDQTHFLIGLGIARKMERFAGEMDRSEEARRNFLAMKQLMAPEKMGKVFKVLIQGKKVPAGVDLDGLQFKPFFQSSVDRYRSPSL